MWTEPTTEYASHETYVCGSDGEYRGGPDLRECLTCGALVGNTDRHSAWHEGD